MSSVSGVSPYASSLWLELPNEPAGGPRPDGTSGAFATGLPPIGPSSDDASLQLVLSILRSDSDKAAANRIRALLTGFAGVIGAFGANAIQRQRLVEQNAANAAEIAGLQQQKSSAASDLATAQDRLQHDQQLDPPDPDLVKADMDAIAAIQASIATLTQTIGNLQAQSDANAARITGLQSGFLNGFASIAAAISRNLASQQRAVGTDNDSSISLIESIYADVQQFLNEAQAIKEQRLQQDRTADEKEISTQQTEVSTRPNADTAATPRVTAETAADNRAAALETAARSARDDAIAQAGRQSQQTLGLDSARANELAGPSAAADDPSARPDDIGRTDAAAIIAAQAARPPTDSTADAPKDDPTRDDRGPDRGIALGPDRSEAPAPQVDAHDAATAVLQHERTANADAVASAERAVANREIADRFQRRDATDQGALLNQLVDHADRLVATLNHLLNPPAASIGPSGHGLTPANLQDGSGRLRIPI
ncbi:hypothetical protein XH83_13265 [Bradyrhizobium sp. CCBAU 53351]|uniref:hypothetical protein n=1 Tax=Bradyrhizobium sp. CCBAU 53351 TaxID=1325114 RepID=UPI001888BFC7|nr:hypothetical protein [Bradyrhizobium sp. CCBAU 53351]QOZ76331.1 hypothetical protein XH83_13265 [Bradyrhizobium sp. CCBAU 53351]